MAWAKQRSFPLKLREGSDAHACCQLGRGVLAGGAWGAGSVGVGRGAQRNGVYWQELKGNGLPTWAAGDEGGL